MADPFLDIEAFKAEYPGTLTAGETTTAERLLVVASDRVRDLAPNARTTDAQQVVFEIVRDAAMYGHLGPLSSFQNITSRRQESGTFDDMAKAVDDLLTDRQKKMLGMSRRASPRGHFKKCDY
ncbi:MAG: hypothetical protein WBB07_17610 [Mycobacterium sp.]